MNTIPYGRQNITQEDIEAVVNVLHSDYLTQGPAISILEKSFADYVGATYAVAVSNGTAGLHLAALALGTNAESIVITTPITFAASANSILYCGGKVELVDIDAETVLLDLNKLEAKLKSSTKKITGIVAVNFAGRPIDLERLKNLATQYGCWIIEDACHSPGGYFVDTKNSKQFCGNGQYADLSVFSFHPVKHIAAGEGGMITTNRKDLYEKLMMLRTHGITKEPSLLKENHGGWYYEMQTLGFNYRLTDFQAALANSQLKRAKDGLERRKVIAGKYHRTLSSLPLKLFPNESGHAYHLYLIHTTRRKELYDYLKEHNIAAQVHYIPIHYLPFYQTMGFKAGMFPVAESYYEGCLSLPMYPSLKDDEQDYVINVLHSFFKNL